MLVNKKDIITLLKREILSLEGLRSPVTGPAPDLGLGFMEEAFPYGNFPLGAVHEMICEGEESSASTAGFISGLLSGLMKNGGAAIWIGSSPALFPPALKNFGIHPDRIVFIDLKNERDILWAVEESLKCEGLAAVVAELSELSFSSSRRFQLAVEQSRVTGFILRCNPRNLQPNTCVSRWKIKPIPTYTDENLPGPGFPRWQTELLKIRNGKTAIWQIEWSGGRFHPVNEFIPSILAVPKRKMG
jgi:protein ImuA